MSTSPAVAWTPVDLGPGVLAGFTGRPGGVSTGQFSGLNLGDHVGDDPAAVADNRELLAGVVGARVWFGRQVHGTAAVAVSDAAQPAQECDASVTATPGLPLAVVVADCVPVLLADASSGVVAAVHAGRPGLLAGVLESAVGRMVELGAAPGRTRAVLGPAAGPCCYEVPEQMRDDAARVLPAVAATTSWGTPSMDLRAGCRQALGALGVADVRIVGGCTIHDDALYSYRRAAVTGRFAGVVALRAAP